MITYGSLQQTTTMIFYGNSFYYMKLPEGWFGGVVYNKGEHNSLDGFKIVLTVEIILIVVPFLIRVC